jgi:heme exporter protein A
MLPPSLLVFLSMQLSTHDLACQRGDRRLFSGLEVCVRAGQLLLVQGGNGRGKTSFLRLLSGLGEPEAGEVRWNGVSIASAGEDYQQAMAYLAHANGVKDDLTPVENVQVQAGLRGQRVSCAEIEPVLVRMGLAACLDLPARVLSFGQRRRVALASLLLSGAALWILDEPLTGLDVRGVAEVEGLLREHVQGGGMVVMTTHQSLQLQGVEIVPLQIGPVMAGQMSLPTDVAERG